MQNLFIHAIECKKASSGVNTGAIKVLTESLSNISKGGTVVASDGGTATVVVAALAKSVAEALSEASKLLPDIPSLAADIDASADFPDQLYLSTSTQPRVDKLWPPDRKYEEIMTGQVVHPHLRIPFSDVIDIYFWEGDFVSRDDFLGQLTVEETTAATDDVQSQILVSEAQGSTYVIAYSVEKTSQSTDSA